MGQKSANKQTNEQTNKQTQLTSFCDLKNATYILARSFRECVLFLLVGVLSFLDKETSHQNKNIAAGKQKHLTSKTEESNNTPHTPEGCSLLVFD